MATGTTNYKEIENVTAYDATKTFKKSSNDKKVEAAYKRSCLHNKNMWRLTWDIPEEYHYTKKRNADGSVTIKKLDNNDTVVREETFTLDDLMKLAEVGTRKIEDDERKSAEIEKRVELRKRQKETRKKAADEWNKNIGMYTTVATTVVMVSKCITKFAKMIKK